MRNMATEKALDGKPYAGNPHVRFEEGASESAKPSRKALLHTQCGGIYDTEPGGL